MAKQRSDYRNQVVSLVYDDQVLKREIKLIDLTVGAALAEVGRINQVLEHARSELARFRSSHPIVKAVLFQLQYGQTPRKRSAAKSWNDGGKNCKPRRHRDAEDFQPSEDGPPEPQD